MRKFCLFLLFIGLATGMVVARNFRFGAEAGLDLSKPSGVTGDFYPGYHFSLCAEYDFSSYDVGWFIGVSPGLSAKPWDNKLKYGTYDAKQVNHPLYLQLPVNAGYRLRLIDNLSLKLFTGPYVAYGIGGKSKVSTYNGASKPHPIEDVDYFGGSRNFRRFDVGWRLGIGFLIHKYFEIGFNSAFQFNSFDRLERRANRSFGVSIGFLL